MDDSDLINEVLEATLAYQRADATAEERARLERLLSDNPQAVAWYLRVVEDTLTLRAAGSAQETQPPAAGDVGSLDRVNAAVSTDDLAETSSTAANQGQTALFESWRRNWRRWAVPAVAACTLLAVAGSLWWSASKQAVADASRNRSGRAAQVVNVSNVEWSAGNKQYAEWSFVRAIHLTPPTTTGGGYVSAVLPPIIARYVVGAICTACCSSR